MLTDVLFLGWYGLVLQLAHEKKEAALLGVGTVVGLLTGQSLCADACVHRPQSFGGLCFRSLLPQEYVRAFFEGRAGQAHAQAQEKKKVSLKSEGMSNAAHKIPAARRTSSRLLACLWSQEVRRC